ncbi:MAG: sensor histidine kinase [Candidatus Kapaibacteriales bacterium]
MASNLPLKTKLTFWYTIIVAFTILAYAFYTYISVSNELRKNLDASLINVVKSIDYLLSRKQEENIFVSQRKRIVNSKFPDKLSLFRELEKMRFVGPIRPSVQREKLADEDLGGIWSAIYEHILLNPRNYFIQIADTNNQIIWRSRNLQNDTLPTLLGFITESTADTIYIVSHSNDSLLKLSMERPEGFLLDSILTNFKIQNTEIRLFVLKTQNAVLSVGYVLSDIQNTLNQLLMTQMIAFPFILIVSIIGGWLLSTASLRPIDLITRTADEITARNLSQRIPKVDTNDEVGHLVRTFNQMIDRIERGFNQVKKFTSDVSHELRTPLTILQGELEIALHSRKTPEEYEDVIVSALEEVGRLSSVVETLLELSRAETGQIKLNFLNENISKIAQDLAEDISIIAEIKKIKIESKIEPEIFLPIDPPRIHQALLNLLENAVKYTPEFGRILFQLHKKDGFAEIIVEDNGIGIPADEIPFIFDRMYRVDKARTSNIKGSGLGLSIVKWIVEAHNGTIQVESEVNKFSRFYVKLPLYQPETSKGVIES